MIHIREGAFGVSESEPVLSRKRAEDESAGASAKGREGVSKRRESDE